MGISKNNNNDTTSTAEAAAEDDSNTGIISHERKEELKLLVIKAITQACTGNSVKQQQHADICAVADGLAFGRKLQLTILTGGLCNYSYKVSFVTNKDEQNQKQQQDGDDVALFAKLTFKKAVGLGPDVPDCSHDRTQCEYDMLEMFAKVTPFPETAMTPYFCLDVIDDNNSQDNENKEGPMKLLVMEFSTKLSSQGADKFIDVTVSSDYYQRFASKLANGLSSLHNTPVINPDLNVGQKSFFHGIVTMITAVFDGYLASSDDDADANVVDGATQLARSMGAEKLEEIITAYHNVLDRQDCYVHGDAHVFNIMVEENDSDNSTSKPITTSVLNGSRTGDFTLIDWEMSHCGPIGKDLGFFLPFPLACVLAHAANGDSAASNRILDCIETLWSDYSAAIEIASSSSSASTQTNKTLHPADIYRQILGFSAVVLLAYSAFGFHIDTLPIEDKDIEGTEGNVQFKKVKESLGILGLKFISIGFGRGCTTSNANDDDTNTLSLAELKMQFRDSIHEEMNRLQPTTTQPQHRMAATSKRSSLLLRRRASGVTRRVSDSSIYAALAATSEELGADGTTTIRRSSSIAVKRQSMLAVEKMMIELEEEEW